MSQLLSEIPVSVLPTPPDLEPVPNINPIELVCSMASRMAHANNQSEDPLVSNPPSVSLILDALLVQAISCQALLISGTAGFLSTGAMQCESALIARLRAVVHAMDALEERTDLREAGSEVPEELEDRINPDVELVAVN